MLHYRIRITDLAEEDLEHIGDYIFYKLKNPSAAINTIHGIQDVINELQNDPHKHELDEDINLANLGIRMNYYRNYKIYYVIDDSCYELTVVRILHMLVDSKNWLYKTFEIDK